jgi:5-methyltetrahydrofolate--homocysteine methyltransferase
VLEAALADAIVEAWSEETHRRITELCPPPFWGRGGTDGGGTDGETDGGGLLGIRPAFGYPCCPNHEDKRLAFDLLDARRLCGLDLTESAMITPAASVCGMYILNRHAFYFSV